MTTRADYLHRLVFGNHFHPCPSEDCKGSERSCSDNADCQPGTKLCQGCYLVQEREQFIARGHSEKCGGWECAEDCGAVARLQEILSRPGHLATMEEFKEVA